MQIHCLTEEDNLQKLDWEEWRVLVPIAGMVTEAGESKLNLLRDFRDFNSEQLNSFQSFRDGFFLFHLADS